MTASLTFSQVLLLLVYTLGMAGGQLLFKRAAERMDGSLALGPRLLALALDPWFLTAIAMYGVLTFYWVWILSFTPLSRAYPFVALAVVITPIVGALAFGEPLTTRLVVGLVAILVGMWLVGG